MQEMQKRWVQSLGGEDSPGGENDNPLQYSCLENPMDREAWWVTVHRVTKSQTWLSSIMFKSFTVTIIFIGVYLYVAYFKTAFLLYVFLMKQIY